MMLCSGTDLRLTIACSYSATSNSILDRAIDSEDAQHKDFLRLVRKNIIEPMNIKNRCEKYLSKLGIILQEHVEGYHELSAKTKIFFSTAVAKWEADFYVKVDDDVHVNLGMHWCLDIFKCVYLFFFTFVFYIIIELSLIHDLSIKVCSLQLLPITVQSPESTLVV